MMLVRTQQILRIFIILAFTFCIGCEITFQRAKTGDDSSLSKISSSDIGSIQLNIKMNESRTLLPELDMVPAGFAVSGIGPDSRTFNMTSVDTSVEIDELFHGNWTVTVDAKNAADIIIATGQGTVFVNYGESSNLEIIVKAIEGLGSLNLGVSWNGENTINPLIVSQIIPPGETAIDINCTITGGNSGTCIKSDLPTGYYTLVVKILDNDIPVIGKVEDVRIVNDSTTDGTYNFAEINILEGTILVEIAADMQNPIDVTLTGQVEEIDTSETMTLTATVPVDVGDVGYTWYLDGSVVGTGASYTTATLIPDVYNIDVVAFNTDYTRSGSASHSFYVIPETPPSAALIPESGSANNNEEFTLLVK